MCSLDDDFLLWFPVMTLKVKTLHQHRIAHIPEHISSPVMTHWSGFLLFQFVCVFHLKFSVGRGVFEHPFQHIVEMGIPKYFQIHFLSLLTSAVDFFKCKYGSSWLSLMNSYLRATYILSSPGLLSLEIIAIINDIYLWLPKKMGGGRKGKFR